MSTGGPRGPGQGADEQAQVGQEQRCPLCDREVQSSERHPRYVCGDCAARAVSAEGHALAFSNVGIDGGFVSRRRDPGEVHHGHVCFIDGVRCHADEARFGGIVVEVVEGEAGY